MIKVMLLFIVGLVYASENVIANIPEASGICYSSNSNSLFVANDEGNIFELSKEGKILRKIYIGNYDLEGVACDDKNHALLFAVEGDDDIIKVSQKDLKILKKIDIKRKFQGVKLLKKDKKRGLEAITLVNGEVLLSNQSNKKWPANDASVVFKIKSINEQKTYITKIYNHGYEDIAGLTSKDEKLYMVSDKKNLLIIYDLEKESTKTTIKLPKFAQEGICFDNDDNIFFADDKGHIRKYKNDEIFVK